jgi:hypothetical protein
LEHHFGGFEVCSIKSRCCRKFHGEGWVAIAPFSDPTAKHVGTAQPYPWPHGNTRRKAQRDSNKCSALFLNHGYGFLTRKFGNSDKLRHCMTRSATSEGLPRLKTQPLSNAPAQTGNGSSQFMFWLNGAVMSLLEAKPQILEKTGEYHDTRWQEDMHDPSISRMLAYKCDASLATGRRVLQGTGVWPRLLK